jgi:hydroxymethylpyrimidine pyrophosphatase-like HAD family hydrolase
MALTNLPAVTCNGACLYDFQKEKEIRRYLLDTEDVLALLYWLEKTAPTVGVRAATEWEFWFNSLDNPYIREDYDALLPLNPKMVPLNRWTEGEIYKLAVRDVEEILVDLRPRMVERFGDRLAITQSDPTLVDVQASGRTKAVLLRELKEISGIPNPYLCVVGDYDNDLEMLREADLPCCPSNAQPCVKAICKTQVGHYRDGAIADVIEALDEIFCK